MSTLQKKIAEGIYSQGWDVIGRGGSWAKALAPVEKYIEAKIARAVKAEREACAKVAESLPPIREMKELQRATLLDCAYVIRQRHRL